MKRQVIAVDIDEVLLPHFQDLADWYNSEYGTHLTIDDNQKHILLAWGVNKAEVAIRRVHRFFDTEKFKQAKPFTEAAEVLNWLSERFELIVITGRDDMIKDFTLEWLEKH